MSVRTDYSMLDAVGRAVLDRSCHFLPNALLVIRMHGIEEVLVRYVDLPRLITEDPKGLVGPSQRVPVQVPQIAKLKLPTAEVRDALRRSEVFLAFSNLVHREFLLSDIAADTAVTPEFPVFDEERHAAHTDEAQRSILADAAIFEVAERMLSGEYRALFGPGARQWDGIGA